MIDIISDDLPKKSDTTPITSLGSALSKDILDEIYSAKEIFHQENLNDDIIAQFLDFHLGLDKQIEKLVKYIMIEFGQNITKHGLQDIGDLQQPVSKMSLKSTLHQLYLETENYVTKKELTSNPSFNQDENIINNFVDQIKKIGNMSYDDLSVEHKKVIDTQDDHKYGMTGEEQRKKGAGLGFIDVAKKIKKRGDVIGQIFTPIIEKINDHIFRFKLITKIPKGVD
ncbi:MAG: DUF6272 family protein [candidate division SR1 bacterium]|nr:DUF6272 family protein [candidate division SR1 bacterium]